MTFPASSSPQKKLPSVICEQQDHFQPQGFLFLLMNVPLVVQFQKHSHISFYFLGSKGALNVQHEKSFTPPVLGPQVVESPFIGGQESTRWWKWGVFMYISDQIIATSHDRFPPNDCLGSEIPLFH